MQEVATGLAGLETSVYYVIAAVVLAVLFFAMFFWGYHVRRNSRALSGAQGIVARTAQDQDLPPQKPVPQFRDAATIVAEISALKSAGKDSALAALRLEYGRLHAFENDDRKAMDQFIKAVVLAKGAGLKELHAEARLELAAVCEAQGDLTTACEHWQIARMIYHELDRQQEVDETDSHMLRNQCPTDWVLTDF